MATAVFPPATPLAGATVTLETGANKPKGSVQLKYLDKHTAQI